MNFASIGAFYALTMGRMLLQGGRPSTVKICEHPADGDCPDQVHDRTGYHIVSYLLR
jgi:hypothetical protein